MKGGAGLKRKVHTMKYGGIKFINNVSEEEINNLWDNI